MEPTNMTNEQFALFIAEKITRNDMYHPGKKDVSLVLENANVIFNWLKSKESEKTKK